MSSVEKLNATTNYTIYLKNESYDSKNFWLFLQKPEGISTNEVYANSSASLFVMPGYGSTNKFVIPSHYSLGAGASNNAVNRGVKVQSNVIKNAQLKETWEAGYATTPPNQGPNLNLVQGQSPENCIGLRSNGFDKARNEQDKWFSNMSFGIETQNGFVGLTWSPSPNTQSIITPKFAFYIYSQDYSTYELADIEKISRQSARIELSDFRNKEVTVTLTNSGDWYVQAGKV